jgi:hypothetical protein
MRPVFIFSNDESLEQIDDKVSITPSDDEVAVIQNHNNTLIT